MATIYSNNETININPTDDLVLYKEEFINSRIEKFLYAICALDFDDLPTPLSRIEELYKCLATGLPAPTFVPQSRVEKYLMAILGSYDVSALPVPQSRTEVLLNKILMGDTDLSDIEWLKSRYEFLLAYIAKGGGVSSGSGNDFEYLQYIFSSSTYSIDRTKELSVKSAVLKGQTLVNLYFEGMQSVENPVVTTIGKNLYPYGNIDFTSTYDSWHDSVGTPEMWGDIGSISKARFFLRKGQYVFSANFDTVENFKGFTLNADDETGIFGYTIGNNDTNKFVVSNDMYVTLRIKLLNKDTHTFMENIQIEEGSVATEYEPYKSTTVTCNEEVELRGIGEVKDELDLLTGEVTRRIGKIVLDGSEDEEWGISTNSNDTIACFHWSKMALFRAYGIDRNKSSKVISDRFPYSDVAGTTTSITSEGVNHIYDSLRICIEVSKLEDVSVASLRNWLSANPTIVHYRLPEEFTVESATLNITDQDGNEAELNSFEDITHVTVTSEGILPDVELSVAKYYPYLTFLLESVSTDTLYNTKELPVKSAILKGQTLVNFAQNEQGGSGVSDIKVTEGRLTWTAQWEWEKLYFVVNGKPNTEYIIKYQSINENIGIFCRPETTDPHSGWVETVSASNQRITTYNEGTFVISLENATVSSDLWIQDFMIIEYQEGMENWDIPYFEDMQSVKMPVLTTSNEDNTKSTTVTCNEEVELRGVGDVKDELDLLTGELTQRIGENNEVLVQEVIKTVDLSVVDQDGNEAELSSFEDITHVTVTSEGILPDVELSVANQFEEDLTTLSLRMNNIATTQEGLEESVDEQTTEVDSTMMATTEIYEGLL